VAFADAAQLTLNTDPPRIVLGTVILEGAEGASIEEDTLSVRILDSSPQSFQPSDDCEAPEYRA